MSIVPISAADFKNIYNHSFNSVKFEITYIENNFFIKYITKLTSNTPKNKQYYFYV